MTANSANPKNDLNANDTTRIDPLTGLLLPDPYVEYIPCPYCSEPEVEVLCYQPEITCHNCHKTLSHPLPVTCGTYPFCKRGTFEEKNIPKD